MGQDTEMKEQVGDIDVDSSTPMEVIGPTEPKKEDPLKGTYTWTIEDYSKLPEKHHSPVFEIGGYQWQLLIFPRGNQASRDQHMSLYLAVADPSGGAEPYHRSAEFKLTIVNQKDRQNSLTKEARHAFAPEANDWGFTNFIGLELLDQEGGFCIGGTVIIEVEATLKSPDEELHPYDSRATTGFVGLRNQGATCYMNSLLQTLYNVNQFRRAVYHMPTEEDASSSASMALALQSVFYKLQFTPGPVSTTDLTTSFGWNTIDAFQQHDVQELNRILCDRLEEKMKGTRVEGMVNQLFEGYTLNYIDCINIDFKSSRREPFQDLQLDVKGCRDIYDSFDKYTEVETLEGENKYEAEGHGKQDARKGVLFDSLPPVLNLHLKRFEYDYQEDVMIKINDRHEFYEDIDLDNGKGYLAADYLSPNADRTVRNRYRLLAVLVHSGGVNGGHYYAYVRPDGKQWLKFDDERVEHATAEQAVRDNWGGEDNKPGVPTFGNTGLRLARFSNAYMLVYVRESEWDTVMCSVTESDISEHVRARLKAEQEAKDRTRKERAEAHLYTMVRIATDEDLRSQIGHPRFFDLVDFDAVSLKVKVARKAEFTEVQNEVLRHLGVSVEKQRYWKWHGRQNGTYRPDGLLPLDSPAGGVITMADLTARRQPRAGEMARLDLFLETPNTPTGNFIPVSRNAIILFFKHYHPGDGRQPPKLNYAGHAITTRTTKIGDLIPLLRKLGGLSEETPVRVLEEVKFDPSVMVEELAPSTNMEQAQLEDGDILVFQAADHLSDVKGGSSPFAKAEEFMKHVRNRVAVTFRRLEGGQIAEGEEDIQLELLRDMAYDDVSATVADRLELDHPLKLKLTAPNPYTGQPRPHSIQYLKGTTFEEMCRTQQSMQNVANPVLFYEVIDLPLPEFEHLVTHSIAFHKANHEETTTVTVRLPKNQSVGGLLEAVRQQLPDEAHGGAPLRLMEVYHWKIWQTFDPSLPIERHLDSSSNPWHLRAEVIPEDQRDLGSDGALHIHCLQVQDKDGNDKTAFPFSDPFIMSVGKDETVGQLKERVRNEMGISEEEFTSWRVVLVSGLSMNMEPLADDVVVAQRFNIDFLGPSKLYGHIERPMLGFHHENKNPRRTHAHINRPALYGQERALKIKA